MNDESLSRKTFQNSHINKKELKFPKSISSDPKANTLQSFLINPFQILKQNSTTLQNFNKKKKIVNPDQFNLTGKLAKPNSYNDNILPNVLRMQDKSTGNSKHTQIDDNTKNAIYNYVRTKENNDLKYIEDRENTDYFHMSLKENQNFTEKKYDFLKPIPKRNHKNDEIDKLRSAPIRYKKMLNEGTLGNFKESLQRKQNQLKNSVIKIKTELLEEKMENQKYYIRDYNFIDNSETAKVGFFPKPFKPNLRTKVMSDSEINDPDKYSKKPINNYDGFARIYFNEKENKKKTNLVNSRFFYATGMLKKHKQIIEKHEKSPNNEHPQLKFIGHNKNSKSIDTKADIKRIKISNPEIKEIIEDGNKTQYVKLRGFI